MSRKQQVRRWALAVALAVGLASTVQSSSQAYEWYPGLPDATFGAWSNAAQGGLSYAKRAKQWFRTPAGIAVTEAINEVNPDDSSGIDQFLRAEAYFVSPEGAPANYGYLAPMTVRTVGFGLMPVEATVQVSQRRANGFPVPIHILLHNKALTMSPLNQYYGPVQVSDAFNVRIVSVKIDGVDVGLIGNCRTVEPAPVTMTSPEYNIPDMAATPTAQEDWFRSHDPSTYFHPYFGGELTGSLTIPPFKGCTTKAGDDLSNLMTLSASGPGNPVVARAGLPCAVVVDGRIAPAAPGDSTPKKAGCPGAKPFVYPARPSD